MSSRKRLQAGEIELIVNSESDAYSEEEETLLLPFLAVALPQEQQPSSKWGLPSGTSKCVHTFIKYPHGKNISQVPYIISGSSPLEVFMLFFVGQPVVETVTTTSNTWP
jgi:hypothetical protein